MLIQLNQMALNSSKKKRHKGAILCIKLFYERFTEIVLKHIPHIVLGLNFLAAAIFPD